MPEIIIKTITYNGVSHNIKDRRKAVITVRAMKAMKAMKAVKAVSKRMDCQQLMEKEARNECIYISKINKRLVVREGRSEVTVFKPIP